MPEPITARNDFDADARMAQTVAGGPRYAPLALEDVSPEGMEQVRVIRAAFSIPESRPFPDVSLITLRHPGMFKGQMVLGIELAKGVIPPRERELAILRLALLARAPFEWSEHVDIGKAFGITPEEIERVFDGSSAAGWTAHEAAILRGVEELLADHCMSDETWNTLAQSWDEKQMLEFPLLVGSYLMTALQQNSLKIQPKGGFDYR
ncbi:carboxymuconolactone decarboxylase family protein [Novosphingobium guangzhouense]|uniref:Carboxymuconolactone decarboxylase n=1 Tax=Novosphingobium guangzhouense TaxID=1850347 RepID=A0A2K2FSW6_9SPHN|nr:carboxymuconolactone decarboxylase family protein [Novosphingobium guangzhouense]PNU01876.1 carboxymuconolactone decarboxylase [Novosphingobium guangzhouense]